MQCSNIQLHPCYNILTMNVYQQLIVKHVLVVLNEGKRTCTGARRGIHFKKGNLWIKHGHLHKLLRHDPSWLRKVYQTIQLQRTLSAMDYISQRLGTCLLLGSLEYVVSPRFGIGCERRPLEFSCLCGGHSQKMSRKVYYYRKGGSTLNLTTTIKQSVSISLPAMVKIILLGVITLWLIWEKSKNRVWLGMQASD